MQLASGEPPAFAPIIYIYHYIHLILLGFQQLHWHSQASRLPASNHSNQALYETWPNHPKFGWRMGYNILNREKMMILLV